jgi:hypothetical protein
MPNRRGFDNRWLVSLPVLNFRSTMINQAVFALLAFSALVAISSAQTDIACGNVSSKQHSNLFPGWTAETFHEFEINQEKSHYSNFRSLHRV